MSSSGAISGEAWLTHAAALRALAAALTKDASEAEDLVQETWLRAARTDAGAETPRAWWSAVVRNLVRDRARERARRAHTEREAARGERVPSEVEVLERLEIAQRVAAEVSRLAEPYRTAIHLRYFEGLGPEAIAKSLGAPLETVRARLRRGLEQLRERMDRAFGGDRSAWSVALGAIALRGEPATLASAGTSLVSLGALVMSLKAALGVVALIGLGFVAYYGRPTGGGPSARSREVVEAPAPAMPASPVATKSDPIEPAPAAREPVAAPVAAVPEPTPLGTIVVIDESGAEHTKESGTFTLDVTNPSAEPVQVNVKDGTWSRSLPEGATYFVRDIVLGERSAIAQPNAGPFVASAQAPRLRASWTNVARLHVVDAASGAELDGVRLYTLNGFEAAGFEVMVRRPKEGLVGESLFSPIEIRRVDEQRGFGLPTHFVGRSGYAWGRIQIDPTAGGDFLLKLQPGGDVHAVFVGATRDARLRLRLYAKDGAESKWVFECGGEELDRGRPPTLELEGLVPGEYALRAETGKQEQGKLLAETGFTVVAGEKTNVTLAIPELPKPEKIEVVFTLEMDPSWEPEKCDLWVEPLNVDPRSRAAIEVIDSSKWTVVEPGTRTAKPVDLDAGRYRCQLHDLCFGAEVTIGPDPRQQVVLKLPAPSRVLVRAVDGESGAAVEGISYTCAWRRAGETRFYGGNFGREQTAPGQCEFLAPTGTIRVEIQGKEYSRASQTLDVSPGGVNEMTLTLLRNYRVEFILREGEKVVPWGMSAMDGIKFEFLDGRRAWAGTSFGSGRLTGVMSEPGVYRVTFPKLAGYLPIEPIEVTLEQRGLIERVLQITRE